MPRQLLSSWDERKDWSQPALEAHYSSLFWACQQKFSDVLSFLIKRQPKAWLLILFQNCAFPVWLYRVKRMKEHMWTTDTRQRHQWYFKGKAISLFIKIVLFYVYVFTWEQNKTDEKQLDEHVVLKRLHNKREGRDSNSHVAPNIRYFVPVGSILFFFRISNSKVISQVT